MRNHLLVVGVAAAALIPTFAFAQTSCEQQPTSRTASTVAGGAIGALLGSAIAGHGDKTTGALIGGVGGAVIGNQVGKDRADCAHAYGYYDTNGAWHATAVERSAAQGYYDRDGRWVAGASNGYYDTQGRWIATAPSANGQGYNANYQSRANWSGAPTDGHSRAAWLDQRIRRSLDDGSLTRSEGKRALRTLNNIRRDEANMRHHNGRLDQSNEVRIQARLDNLSSGIRWARANNTRDD